MNCPRHCIATLNGAFWLNNQRYWVYKCPCCQARQIQKGIPPKEVFHWGGSHE